MFSCQLLGDLTQIVANKPSHSYSIDPGEISISHCCPLTDYRGVHSTKCGRLGRRKTMAVEGDFL